MKSKFRLGKNLLFSALILFLAASWTITPYCGFLFACGCSFSEGMSQCNIFDPSTPNCPWCSYGQEGFYAPFLAILALSMFSAAGSLVWISQRVWAGIAGGLIGYLVFTALVGLITAWIRGYPYFGFWVLASEF